MEQHLGTVHYYRSPVFLPAHRNRIVLEIGLESEWVACLRRLTIPTNYFLEWHYRDWCLEFVYVRNVCVNQTKNVLDELTQYKTNNPSETHKNKNCLLSLEQRLSFEIWKNKLWIKTNKMNERKYLRKSLYDMSHQTSHPSTSTNYY